MEINIFNLSKLRTPGETYNSLNCFNARDMHFICMDQYKNKGFFWLFLTFFCLYHKKVKKIIIDALKASANGEINVTLLCGEYN